MAFPPKFTVICSFSAPAKARLSLRWPENVLDLDVSADGVFYWPVALGFSSKDADWDDTREAVEWIIGPANFRQMLLNVNEMFERAKRDGIRNYWGSPPPAT